MKDKKPSDPYNLKYVESEHIKAEDVFIVALEPIFKSAEEKVLAQRTKCK
jgi:hypothetical protein